MKQQQENRLNQHPTTYEDAVDCMLKFIETDKRFAYIVDIRTKIVRLKMPDWKGKDFEEARAMLVIDLMPFLFPSLTFSTTKLTTEDYYALWGGLAEHLLITVE